MELVAQVLLGVVVFGGLALREYIVGTIASLDSSPDLVEPDDLD